MSNRNPSAPYQQGGQPPLPGQNAYGQTPEQAAAHAAAWAAYYQSQGITAPQGYSAPSTPAQPATAGAPAAQNPYANYGYGAGAQHNKPQQPPAAGPSQHYRPPPNVQAFATTSTQPSLGYPQQPAYPAQPQYPQAGYQPGRPPYQQTAPPAQQPYVWQPGQQPQTQPGQPAHRPPAQPQQPYPGYAAQPAAAYYPPAQPQSGPYTPPQPSTQSPYRPSMGAPNVSSPMQPQPTQFRPPVPLVSHGRPPRPPMAAQPGGGGGGFPPAKRPRFDGPGGAGNRLPQARPPNIGPQGPPMGQRNVSRPNVPINRPPIHLGSGLPLVSGAVGSSVAFAPPSGPGQPKAGPMRGNDSRRGGRGGGMLNAPRGPATMRRPDGSFAPSAFSKGVAPSAGKNTFDKRGNKKLGGAVPGKDTGKATMTDWRIVGVEMKELGWSWGIVDGQTEEDESEVKVEGQEPVEAKNGEAEVKVELPEPESTEPIESASAPVPLIESSEPAPVKLESSSEAQTEVAPTLEGESAAAVAEETEKEKRGAKRKAKSPDTEDGDEHHSAKRSVPFKTTTPSATTLPLPPSESAATTPQQHSQRLSVSPVKATSDVAKDLLANYENNSNRLRIYFDSPPELDRAPKVKKTPVKAKEGQEGKGSKRFRSVSVSASVVEEKDEDGAERDEEHNPEAADPAQEQGETEHVETAQGDDQAQEDVDRSLGLIESDAPSPTPNDTVDDSAAVTTLDIHSTKDAQGAEEPVEEPQPEPSESHDSVVAQKKGTEAKDEVGDGDVSMRTDKGDVLEETPVDESQVEKDEEPQPDAPGINGDSKAPEATAILTSAAAAAEATEPQDEDKKEQKAEAAQTANGGEGLDDKGNEEVKEVEAKEASDAAAALAESASNAASAYQSRTRRHSSVSLSSHAPAERRPSSDKASSPGPSWNRLSVVWEQSTRRLCFDAEVVGRVRIWRKEGKIEVELKEGGKESKKESEKEGEKEGEDEWTGLPKGVMMEMYDPLEQRFLPYTSPSDDPSVPPLNLISPTLTHNDAPVIVTVHLNTKNALSEPKWLKSNQADAWLFENFESKKGADAGWRGKLEVMDPDPAPTLPGILDGWASNCTLGTPSSRRAFTSFLSSSPDELLEILLRLGRGDRNPTLGSSSSPSFGPLATLIRPDSPFANHQTHVSLAILAMYRLTTDMAEKAGEKKDVVEEKVGDIIRSLPAALVTKSLDGLFREWQG
ncbi:hypothetical protein IAR50_006817 [Cryptococcus sp. DSM 104548]